MSDAIRKTKRVQHHACNSDSFGFFNLLTRPELLDRVEAQLPAHRERLFPPTETLSMFLAQVMSADGSCRHIVNQAATQRLLGGLPLCSTSTGGYCRARERLPLSMVRALAQQTGAYVAAQWPKGERWRGRPVRLVDGTTVTMPDTPANQAAYPQQRNQKPGLGFPICRIVGVTCLATGALLDAAISRYQGKGAHEQALLRELLDNFEPGDVMLGDALYATYFLLASLQARGIDAVFEQHGSRRRSTNFGTGKRLGAKDHLIELDKPKKRPHWMTPAQYAAAPDRLTVREFKAGSKIMVTTLCQHRQAPKHELKALYDRRWHIELDFRQIKTTLRMERLSCRTPAMNEKEMWVCLLAYNLIRWLMAESAAAADVQSRQLSFKHTLQLWLAWRQLGHRCLDAESAHQMRLFVAQGQVPYRPGRSEPRAIKRRPKPFPLLTKPRPEARAEIQQHGHPVR